MNFKDAQRVVASHGHTLKHDSNTGEYIVHPKGANENHPSAYFTDDLPDAVGTSSMMQMHRQQQMKQMMLANMLSQQQQQQQPQNPGASQAPPGAMGMPSPQTGPMPGMSGALPIKR